MKNFCRSNRTNRYGCCGSIPTQERQEPTERRPSGPEVARSYLDALSRGDIDGVLALAAPGGRQVDLGASGAGADLGERRRRLDALRSAYEEIEFRLIDCWETEGRVAFRWRADGTTLCGKVVELRGLDMFELDERGRILRHWLDLRPERYFPELGDCSELDGVAQRFGWGAPSLGSRSARRDPERGGRGQKQVGCGAPEEPSA